MRRYLLLIAFLLLFMIGIAFLSFASETVINPTPTLVGLSTPYGGEGFPTRPPPLPFPELNEVDIAYLADPTAIRMHPFFDHEYITGLTGAIFFTDGEALALADTELDFDIVLVHVSAMDMVDTTWTQSKYREGTVITGFNVSKDDMVNLTGDHCQSGHFTLIGDYFVMYRYFVATKNEADLEAIHLAELVHCKDAKTQNRYGVSVGGGRSYATRENSQIFEMLLRNMIRDRVIASNEG